MLDSVQKLFVEISNYQYCYLKKQYVGRLDRRIRRKKKEEEEKKSCYCLVTITITTSLTLVEQRYITIYVQLQQLQIYRGLKLNEKKFARFIFAGIFSQIVMYI
eukprot:TRINITY_DN1165_c0_g1_i4.p5 TRINITY_DN1165_c0_g1~~TRINITY_DN1165_c0_g1_i4.p5  ORF type:complete len:104 (-),score=6.62 TRINITY_DN1165_c0_g1_i4:317-628(-)